MLSVEVGDEVELGALARVVGRARRFQIKDRRAVFAKRRALESGRQPGVAPVARAADRLAGVVHDDERGKVLVFGAEAVSHPVPKLGRPARMLPVFI